MSPPLRLQYFNLKARAELSRLLLAAAGVDYADERYSGSEAFPVLHDPAFPSSLELQADPSHAPFGQLPILVVGETVIPQSKAIERYIAREHGFFGKTSLEAALIDAVTEVIEDQRAVWLKLQTDEEKLESVKSGELAKSYKQLDAFAQRHGDGKHFVGSLLSLADVSLFSNLPRLIRSEELKQQAYDALRTVAPTLHAITETVRANKGIAKWLETRPKSI